MMIFTVFLTQPKSSSDPLLMLLQVKSGIPSGCVQGESGHLSTVEGLRRFSCLGKLSSSHSQALEYKVAFHITSLRGYVCGLEHMQPIATRHTMAHFSLLWSFHTSTAWVAPSLGNDWLTTVTRLLLTPLTQEQSAEHCKDLCKIHKCVCEWDIVQLYSKEPMKSSYGIYDELFYN